MCSTCCTCTSVHVMYTYTTIYLPWVLIMTLRAVLCAHAIQINIHVHVNKRHVHVHVNKRHVHVHR